MRWIACCVLALSPLALGGCSGPAIPTEELGNVVYEVPKVPGAEHEYVVPELGEPPPPGPNDP